MNSTKLGQKVISAREFNQRYRIGESFMITGESNCSQTKIVKTRGVAYEASPGITLVPVTDSNYPVNVRNLRRAQ